MMKVEDKIAIVDFQSFDQAVPEALDAMDAGRVLADQEKILIKPNLVNDSPHPITTSPECCRSIVEYVRRHSDASIVIGDGCGDSVLETDAIFEALGYCALAEDYDIELVDLNHAPLKHLKQPDRPVFPEMFLPEMAMTHYLISVPVLKAHSLSVFTGTLKNMIGLAPPEHYAGRYGDWKKAVFHGRMQQSIMDLNSYRVPDLTVMDASIGMPDFHLGGAHCDPPIGKIVAGYDPFQVDRRSAELLGLDWTGIAHLADHVKT